MKIRVDEKIRIQNPTPAIKKWCKENLILDNPDYYKKERMGLSVYGTPKTISLYETAGDEIWLPFGCVKNIWRMCTRGLSWSIDFSPIRPFNYDSNIKLYPYQEDAVNKAIRAKNGILVMPCGSGKTQSGLETIARIGGRALWLTHTKELLNQSKSRAESVLGNVGAGIITAGKVNVGNGITFATIQTMCKIDLLQYRNFWDVIVVDECQHCAGSPTRVTQFYKVMSNLCARYKFGLTATPKRADGLEMSMFALLGDVIHEVDREDVETICPIKIEKISTGWIPKDDVLSWDGTIDYNKVVDSLTHDEERFDVVLNYLGRCTGGCIVLANRVEYLNKMCKAYTDGQFGNAVCLSGTSNNKDDKAYRRKALEALNTGELDCIFATYQLAKEGLDVPNLNYVILATPEHDKTTVIQSVGRVGRKADGKEYGTVIDFVDEFGLYKKWSRERDGFYKKIGVF